MTDRSLSLAEAHKSPALQSFEKWREGIFWQEPDAEFPELIATVGHANALARSAYIAGYNAAVERAQSGLVNERV